MNILVTGISGFLGRHVAAEIVKRGHMLVRRQIDLLSEFTIEQAKMMGPVDVVIHCAAICRWHPRPNSDERFAKNLEMARKLHDLVREGTPIVLPLPHGALKPFNAYSSAARAVSDQHWSQCVDAVAGLAWSYRKVYLPTLYGEGDPHHAKALPSFMLCATGRGESRMVLYGDGDTRRQFMHVERAAAILVDVAVTPEVSGLVVPGELWSIAGLAQCVMEGAERAGRQLEAPERRPWQFRPDGLGSPTPADVGPVLENGGSASSYGVKEWVFATIKKRLDERSMELDAQRENEARLVAKMQEEARSEKKEDDEWLEMVECGLCRRMGIRRPVLVVDGIASEFCRDHSPRSHWGR